MPNRPLGAKTAPFGYQPKDLMECIRDPLMSSTE
jgi:hypothetical protein